MPRRAKSICRRPGCGALTDKPGLCVKHAAAQHKEDAAQRGTAAERGYDSRWTKARAHYLRAHPLCVEALKEGRVVAAEVVDHIIPPRIKEAMDSGDPILIAKAKALFWDSENNWQSLSKAAHDRKTATEDGGFGRDSVKQS